MATCPHDLASQSHITTTRTSAATSAMPTAMPSGEPGVGGGRPEVELGRVAVEAGAGRRHPLRVGVRRCDAREFVGGDRAAVAIGEVERVECVDYKLRVEVEVGADPGIRDLLKAIKRRVTVCFPRVGSNPNSRSRRSPVFRGSSASVCPGKYIVRLGATPPISSPTPTCASVCRVGVADQGCSRLAGSSLARELAPRMLPLLSGSGTLPPGEGYRSRLRSRWPENGPRAARTAAAPNADRGSLRMAEEVQIADRLGGEIRNPRTQPRHDRHRVPLLVVSLGRGLTALWM